MVVHGQEQIFCSQTDFLSALESASIANDSIQSIFHAHHVLQFVHLNGLKLPIYVNGPLNDIDVHSALT